jgi:gamma-glutamyltranspeptidase
MSDQFSNAQQIRKTLLSTFGSKFVLPQSGIAMNNGIMWFDPTPGGPNSLAPGKRCLTNYTPVLAQTADGRRLALGASGGRRILPAVTQMLSFVMDYGMDLNAAIHTPAHRCERRRCRDRRCAFAGTSAGSAAGAFRLRGSARADLSDEVRLPERGAARRRDQ